MIINELTHLSLCSGIGGLDLAAEWAGFKTLAQCEIDDYASKVLAKNFKGVPNLHDIRTITNGRLRECGINPAKITVISAGFPCQPYSLAGKGLGDSDSRDLWGEVARVLGELQPHWFVGENTPGLFARENQRYFRRILNDLAALGYSVGWGIWGAVDVGAPHKRDRVFIVAHANGKRRKIQSAQQRIRGYGNFPDSAFERQYPNEIRRGELAESRATENERRIQESGLQFKRICSSIPDTVSIGKEKRREKSNKVERYMRDWQTEPDVGRVANGVSARVDRLRCLGNAVVPSQAYPIFEAIAELETAMCG